MPTPVGHALAGVTTALVADLAFARRNAGDVSQKMGGEGRSIVTVSILCAILAVACDLDVIVGMHRSYTHTLGAVLLVWVAVWMVLTTCGVLQGGVAGSAWEREDGFLGARFGMATLCAAAYATHPFLDWLGRDSSAPLGLMALWPLTDAYFLSGLDVFLDVSRRYWKPDEFIFGNMRSVWREVWVLGPVLALALILRRRRIVERQNDVVSQ